MIAVNHCDLCKDKMSAFIRQRITQTIDSLRLRIREVCRETSPGRQRSTPSIRDLLRISELVAARDR